MVIRHWALFIEGPDEIKWSFGMPDNDDNLEFQSTTVRFIQSLQAIGKELYSGEGVASIKLANPSKSPLMANEIFIVNLSDQFFFIISDLAVTSRLIAVKGIPFEIEQIIRAVLVGQASILYSTLLMDEETGNYNTDAIIREILVAIELEKQFNIDELISEGRISLSQLKFEELLLFHYLLRDYLENQSLKVSLSSQDWAIMVDSSGMNIPLQWRPPKDPHVLGNFLGVIYRYIQGLFGTKPAAIIFGGGAELIYLRFFGGDNYFLAASNPQALIRDGEFILMLKKVPDIAFKDIELVLKEFIINQTLNHLGDVLTNIKYRNLIALFQNLDSTYFEWRELTLLDIQGLGSKAQEILRSHGIMTLEDLQKCDFEKIEFKSSRITLSQLKQWKNEAKRLLQRKGGFEITISPLSEEI